MKNKALILLRGLPGSGKSTLAQIIVRHPDFICTADDYHMVDGKYDWKSENVAFAHMKCQEKCEMLMKATCERIVVANTLTTLKELKPYYDLAEKYEYKVFSVIVENRHDGVNEHNVPEDTLKKMRERFDIKL